MATAVVEPSYPATGAALRRLLSERTLVLLVSVTYKLGAKVGVREA